MTDTKTKPNRLGVAGALAQPSAIATNGEAPKTRGGRPPKAPTERVHLVIEPDAMAYARRAWRLHTRPDGTPAASVSDLLEDLLREHQRKYGKRIDEAFKLEG